MLKKVGIYMCNYEINVLECQVNLPIEYDNYLLGCVLKFLKVGNQKVIAKVFIKNNATGKEFYVYDYSMYNTTALTFISFVKSVIPSVIDNIIQEQEYIIDFISILEMQGVVKKLENQGIELNEMSNSESLYNEIYTDMKDMCKDLNIDSQILSARDKEIVNNAVEEDEEKMLNADADFDPNFEILRNKLGEVSNRDITAKVEVEIVEEEDENPDIHKVAKRMNRIEESVKNSKSEFISGREYFLLNQMGEYMWKYLKSVNSRFLNPEFLGICDYYLNTQSVFDPETRSFMIKYCINKSKMKA